VVLDGGFVEGVSHEFACRKNEWLSVGNNIKGNRLA
jgi:hypothetical protein